MISMLDVESELEYSAQRIVGQLSPKAREKIEGAAHNIAQDPSQIRAVVRGFLRPYAKRNPMVFGKMFREVTASLEITWKSYQAFVQNEKRKEFEQYCQRILTGCWLAMKDLKHN